MEKVDCKKDRTGEYCFRRKIIIISVILVSCLMISLVLGEEEIPSRVTSTTETENIVDLGPANLDQFMALFQADKEINDGLGGGIREGLSFLGVGSGKLSDDELITKVKNKLETSGHSVSDELLNQVKQRVGEIIETPPSIDDGGGSETGGTGSEELPENPTENLPEVANPDALCNEDSYTADISKLTGSLDGEEINKEDFIDQWCAFYKSNNKKETWDQLSDAQKTKFFEALGNEYGLEIKGLDGGSWGDDKQFIVNGNTINLDLEAYYKQKEFEFGFRDKDDYTYNPKTIREITATEDGISIGFGDKGKSKLDLKGKDIEFDPHKRTVSSNGKDYVWNGQGNVEFDADTGKMKLSFAQGESNTDATNFPILTLPNGEEVSPFQVSKEGLKAPEGLKKPSKGFAVSDDGKYTIDSNGVVREIQSTEVEIDKTSGEVKAIKNAYLNKKEFGGDLFAKGEFGLSADSEKKNFIDYLHQPPKSNILTVLNNDGELFFVQSSDLKKLDVKGAGTTHIRNGDKVLTFAGDKLTHKVLPKDFQKEGGKFTYTIDEIQNYKSVDNPYKLVKDENGAIELRDSSGKIVPPGGESERPPENEGGEGEGEGGEGEGKKPVSKPFKARGAKEVGEGELEVGTRLQLEVFGKEIGLVQSTFNIEGIDGLPKGLSEAEFVDALIKEGAVNLKVDILDSQKVTKKAIILALQEEDAPASIVSKAQELIPSNPQGFGFSANKGQISFNGQAITDPNVVNDGVDFIKKKIMVHNPPKLGKLVYTDGSGYVNQPGIKPLYAYYKHLGS